MDGVGAAEEEADAFGEVEWLGCVLNGVAGAVFTDTLLVPEGEDGGSEGTADANGGACAGSLVSTGAVGSELVSGFTDELEGNDGRAVCITVDGDSGPPVGSRGRMRASTLIRTTTPRPIPSAAMTSIRRFRVGVASLIVVPFALGPSSEVTNLPA